MLTSMFDWNETVVGLGTTQPEPSLVRWLVWVLRIAKNN